MSKHTPGPWTGKSRTLTHGGWRSPEQLIDITAGETLIASYSTAPSEYPDDQTNVANARLIAAAPDLLEALKALCAAPLHSVDARSELWVEAVAAIAKAEGKQ